MKTSKKILSLVLSLLMLISVIPISGLAAAEVCKHTNAAPACGREPTCSMVGYKDGVYCNDCKTWISGHEEIPTIPHCLGGSFEKEPTCTEDGGMCIPCSECDYIYYEERIPALEHKFTDYEIDMEATCLRDGTVVAYCDYGCGEKDTQKIDKLEHIWGAYEFNNDTTHITKCINCDLTMEECHEFRVTVISEPTCEMDEVLRYECLVCCHTHYEMGEKLEHLWGDYEYNNDATCEFNGTATAICLYGCGATDTREVDGTALEHKWGNYEYNNDATCERNGTATAICYNGCGWTDTREVYDSMLEHGITKVSGFQEIPP